MLHVPRRQHCIGLDVAVGVITIGQLSYVGYYVGLPILRYVKLHFALQNLQFHKPLRIIANESSG